MQTADDKPTGADQTLSDADQIASDTDQTSSDTRAPEKLVVAFIDVDGLKLVNDTQGHLAGGALLVAVADSVSIRECAHAKPAPVMRRSWG